MKKFWFKRKKYGYGWVPSSWEGWFVLVLYILFLVLKFENVNIPPRSSNDTIFKIVVPMVVATSVLLAVCYIKGEKLKWVWGDDNHEEENTKK